MASSKNHKALTVIQTIGRSFFLPISILPVAGLLLGIGASFSNLSTVQQYGLESIMGAGTVLNHVFMLMSSVGNAVFANLPLLFALAVAMGMAKEEKAVAVLSAALSFIIMHVTIHELLVFSGQILPFGPADAISLNIRIPADRPHLRIGSIAEIAVSGKHHLLIQRRTEPDRIRLVFRPSNRFGMPFSNRQIDRENVAPPAAPVDVFRAAVVDHRVIGVTVGTIEFHRGGDLLEIARAFDGTRPPPRLIQRGQQYCRQNGDNRNHDQKFNQSKWSTPRYPGDVCKTGRSFPYHLSPVAGNTPAAAGR